MNRKQKKLVLGVFIAAVVMILAVFGTMAMRKNKKQEQTSGPVSTSGVTTSDTTPAPTKNPHEGMVKSELRRWQRVVLPVCWHCIRMSRM